MTEGVGMANVFDVAKCIGRMYNIIRERFKVQSLTRYGIIRFK